MFTFFSGWVVRCIKALNHAVLPIMRMIHVYTLYRAHFKEVLCVQNNIASSLLISLLYNKGHKIFIPLAKTIFFSLKDYPPPPSHTNTHKSQSLQFIVDFNDIFALSIVLFIVEFQNNEIRQAYVLVLALH